MRANTCLVAFIQPHSLITSDCHPSLSSPLVLDIFNRSSEIWREHINLRLYGRSIAIQQRVLRLLTSSTRAPSGLLIVELRSRNILESLLRPEGKSINVLFISEEQTRHSTISGSHVLTQLPAYM